MILLLVLGSCAQPTAVDTVALERETAPPATSSVAATAETTTTTTAPPPPPPAPTTTTTTAPPPPPPTPRTAWESGFAPFARAGELTLLHPARIVEMVGFHESSHDGAQSLEVLPSAVNPRLMESRERGTGGATATDIVVHPEVEIRSPVTGTVKRGGTYVLYCKHSDDYLVIEPDDRPGWEVKLLHISGLRVSKGERVVAGQTVVANHATPLPFESQVDESTADPAWPHVHLEVVDPTIKDRPSPGGGCS